MKTESKYIGTSDEKLVELYAGGERPAFDEIYSRYSRRLYYYIYRMLNKDSDRAKDILQDVLLKLARKPELFDTKKRFSTWIYSVAFNTLKNEIKSNGRAVFQEDYDLESLSYNSNIIEKYDSGNFSRLLDLELDLLSYEHRTAFILRYKEDQPIAEIAEIMSCPVGTVKSRLHHAIKKLSLKLKEFNPIEDGD